MNLRLRLALAVSLTALPLIAGMGWFLSDLEREAAEDNLRTLALTRMGAGGRERCEASPQTFGSSVPAGRGGRGLRRGRGRRGPRFGIAELLPRVELWAYDQSMVSANPRAPVFPAALRRALEAGADTASSWTRQPGSTWQQVTVVLRTGWTDSPCATLLVRGSLPPPALPLGLDWTALAVAGVAVLAVLLAAGPIVHRIRRLTEDVRVSAASRYERSVDVRGNDEIARLGAAFNEARQEIRSQLTELERREHALRDFLGDTTHDVMLPLTVLQGHLTRLRDAVEKGDPVDRATVLSALDETHYMASLVHNLSAVAKLEAGASHQHRDVLDLGALVGRAVARHRPIAQARRIALEFSVPEEPVHLLGDVTLVEQAVGNVIHNAVRYNRDGGHVAVVLETRDDGHFSLRVIDDGPGIPDADLQRLPERSFRGGTARTRHPGGQGLGLHIAQRVAREHGLSLELRRSEYGGLEVELGGELCAAASDS